jgi:hypothetical protein
LVIFIEVNPCEASSASMLESGGTTSEAAEKHVDDIAQMKTIIKLFVILFLRMFLFCHTSSSLPD